LFFKIPGDDPGIDGDMVVVPMQEGINGQDLAIRIFF
jgi:hypothetical protein